MSHNKLDLTTLFSVKDKVVVVTGAGRGIGYMIANAFVQNGAIVYTSSRNEAQTKKVAEELTKIGPGRCYSLPGVDLATVSGCETLAKHLKEKVERVDVLVNNSGATWGEPLETTSELGWDKVMDLNVKGVFFLTKALLPLLEKAATPSDPARIINISSIAGLRPQVIPTYAYDCSKTAVNMLTQKLAQELSPRNITCNCVAPGVFPSKMGDQVKRNVPNIEDYIPLGRLGSPEDIGGVILYLSSRASAWTTGAIIQVDGGALFPGLLAAKL